MAGTIDTLTTSSHPSIRYKTMLNVLGEDPESAKMQKLRSEIRRSTLAKQLLSERSPDGKIPYHPYGKWYGPHWVLTALADNYYPEGDRSLLPLRNAEYEWLFSESHMGLFTNRYLGRVFPPERLRIHASIEGNAIFSLLRLGLDDKKTDELVDRLLKTRWPDGGWNCDRRLAPYNPQISSFHETITPLRALALHARLKRSSKSRNAAKKASEVFLKRRMYRRQRDGKIMDYNFRKLHYPPYWHYDILMGLKVMAEAGFIKDKRCDEALEVLESKRLKDGGFPAEAKYYHTGRKTRSAMSLIDWGGTSPTRMNEFVTVDALGILKAAGRI